MGSSESITILFITSNTHKYIEVAKVLENCNPRIRIVQSNASKVEVQSDSLLDVASYAAMTAYLNLGRPLIVEDAGLFIGALNGFPGPYSSYVFKTIGIEGVLKLMKGVKRREAYFESVIALAYSEGVEVFRGRVYGRIASEPRGSKGFGFDPIFIPRGSSKTFGEMDVEEKNRVSHRARAAIKLCRRLSRRRIV
jgi:XTP/dITP diphosphohydrolase